MTSRSVRPTVGTSDSSELRKRVSERRLHVAIVCGEYPPFVHGGVGTIVQLLARQLVKDGLRVTVVGTYLDLDVDRDEVDEGVRVIRLSSRPGLGRAVKDARRFWRVVRRLADVEGVDVIEGSELSFWAAPRHTPPLVIRMHGGHRFFADAARVPVNRPRAWMEKRSFDRADELVAVSRYVGKQTTELLGQSGRRFTVIPNAVDTALFRPVESVRKVPGSVLFFGTLCEKKGVRQLIDAWPAIVEGHPQSTLTLIGRDTTVPGSGESYRDAMVARLPSALQETVEFTGPLPHHRLPNFLHRSELCVLPSHMEAQAMAWLEVLASGTPLITGDIGPAREVISPSVNGELVNPHDHASISAKVIELMEDEGARKALSKAAIESSREFTIERCAKRSIHIYDKTVSIERSRNT